MPHPLGHCGLGSSGLQLRAWPTGMLRTMAAAVRSETYFAVLTLTPSVCHGLRVGKAASIHRVNIIQPD